MLNISSADDRWKHFLALEVVVIFWNLICATEFNLNLALLLLITLILPAHARYN
jgi:hypothetical protein